MNINGKNLDKKALAGLNNLVAKSKVKGNDFNAGKTALPKGLSLKKALDSDVFTAKASNADVDEIFINKPFSPDKFKGTNNTEKK